jgi:uncharacterized membrane protein
MATTAYADPSVFLGTSVPASWTPSVRRSIRRSLFGDLVLVAFLLAQCLDGVFTYIGVMTYGLGIEANPLLAGLMAAFGHGVTLASAKVIAAALGIALHLRQVHSAVAILAGFYFAVAILPWIMILFG